MTIICRIAQNTDIPEIVDLMLQLGYTVSQGELLQVVEAIRQRGGEIFVAEADGKAVGCVNAIIDPRLAEGVTGEIASLVVHQQYRGIGIGKSLMQFAENWLGSITSKIRVRANVKRENSYAFYAALGYELTKEQKVFIKNV